jgi:hypothetical protein
MQINGVMHAGEVPDGTIQMDVGATDDGNGCQWPPIEAIDWHRGSYRRLGCQPQPIPRHWRNNAINWQPVQGATS